MAVFPNPPRLLSLEDRYLLSTVTNLMDAGPGSLRQAILDTPAGGTVDFQPGLTGTITLTSGELLMNKDLTIAGPGMDVVTVSGNHASRVFDIHVATAAISGLTIADGSVSDTGGGILNDGTLTLTDCLVRNNSALGNGGGITNAFGNSLTLTSSTLSGNSAGGNGGGIYNDLFDGPVTVTRSTLNGNSCTGSFSLGAGIYNHGGSVAVTSSAFRDNSASGEFSDGGGIWSGTNGMLTVISCTFSHNLGSGISTMNSGVLTVSSSTFSENLGAGIENCFYMLTVTNSTFSANSGDGIFNSFGTAAVTTSNISGSSFYGIINAEGMLTVTSCTLSGNLSGVGNVEGTVAITSSTLSGNSSPFGMGGGIENDLDGILTVTGSTVSGNSAFRGAGIYNVGSVTIMNSTVSGNAASDSGGGIYNDGESFMADVTVINSTLSGNSADTGGGITNFGQLAVTYARNTIVAGNIAPGSPDMSGPLNSQGHNLIGDGTGGSGFDPTDQVGTSDNPIDPRLGPLQDNGGPTLTMALLPGSPAIDAGDNTGAPMWDQRGAPFRRIVNGIIDIGAFEVQARGHGGPTHQPLPDSVPVQVLGTPAEPLFEQPAALPADPSPQTGTGAPNGAPGTDPVATAGGQPAADSLSTANAGNGQPENTPGLLGRIPGEFPALGLGGS